MRLSMQFSRIAGGALNVPRDGPSEIGPFPENGQAGIGFLTSRVARSSMLDQTSSRRGSPRSINGTGRPW